MFISFLWLFEPWRERRGSDANRPVVVLLDADLIG
jgi:hypothetical protein